MKIAEWQGKAKAWCEKTGLRRDYAREFIGTASGRQVYGLEREKKERANPANKFNDTLKVNGKEKEMSLMQQIKTLQLEKIRFGKLKKSLSDEQIIQRLAGKDNTAGSCASVSYAYAMNKAGYDVLDYRGGKSADFFSLKSTNIAIAKLKGVDGIIVEDYNDFIIADKLMSAIKEGHIYSMGVGGHRTIVKKENGKIMYLEFQQIDPTKNKFYELSKEALKERWFCSRDSKTHGIFSGTLIDIEKLVKNKEFRILMRYINTKEHLQQKTRGGIKKMIEFTDANKKEFPDWEKEENNLIYRVFKKERKENSEILFSFDKKIIFNFWTDFPDKLTKEQKSVFVKEFPILARLKGIHT